MKNFILNETHSLSDYIQNAGGKALNLHKMRLEEINVPSFITVSNKFFEKFIIDNDLKEKIEELVKSGDDLDKIEEIILSSNISTEMKEILFSELKRANLDDCFLAIRSSGLDEDSGDHSFAGMFSSYLYQKGHDQICQSIKKCWASAYSKRCIEYRINHNLSTSDISMGVVLQKMIDSQVSGVMFTRNPLDVVDKNTILIESIYGQCEGLVSGAIEGDSFKINRIDSEASEKKLAQKDFKYIQNCNGYGLDKKDLSDFEKESLSLSSEMLIQVRDLGVKLENTYGLPLDIEWAIDDNQVFVLQMRPITTLPSLGYYLDNINGSHSTLWDNSNIVESFNGVTTALTFSLTKDAYEIVYKQTLRLLGVPESIISKFNESFENLLGYIRGRVYYNLIHWYKVLFLIPGFSNNQEFMETMMGVKEELNKEQQEIFNFEDIPQYSKMKSLEVSLKLLKNFIVIDKSVTKFTKKFDIMYQDYKSKDFNKFSPRELMNLYKNWEQKVTYSWETPIVNDLLVMFFFGTLKKLTTKWIGGEGVQHLQNDLLCGQGELESTKPTLTLMGLAEKYDKSDAHRSFFEKTAMKDLYEEIKKLKDPTIHKDILHYLDLYGFRCNNEQKLEENDLHDDPSFVLNSIQKYIKNKNYDIEELMKREHAIRSKAESRVKNELSGIKYYVYNWVLKHTRNAVKNRENLRFLRSKSFGVNRLLFRAMGVKFKELDLIDSERDIFFLTYREIFDFITGRSETIPLRELVKIRKAQDHIFRQEQDPPDRFITHGTVGLSFSKPNIIQSGDLLKGKLRVSDDPNLIYGISCCPGIVKAKVLVAQTIEEAQSVDGEILVTKRTDPGWVPLFPSCKGLIIERGSLLSHSAVIARELGLPTIVGVSGDIFSKLTSGDLVELNATTGEIRKITDEG